MHDVIVLYNHPDDPDAFDIHYRTTHIPLVEQLPLLSEFSWGKVAADDGDTSGYYAVARLTYASAADAEESLGSPAGRASVEDLANFAAAGVAVLNVNRQS